MKNDNVFGSPEPSSLAGLVFELASQLHVERTRRMALETVLSRANLIAINQIESLAEDGELIAQSRAGLDHSMERLMRIILESDDVRVPLRHETRVKSVRD